MILQTIQYENFKNHQFLKFEPSEGINLVFGENGSGKTSILEGIHYCALTRGFVNPSDLNYLSFTSDFFLLNGFFIDENQKSINVKVSFNNDREKKITVNNSEIKPFSRHIGLIPCITFSPSEIVIVNGSPMERRRFIDTAISQIDRRYLDDLLAYRKVTQQRNALLLQFLKEKRVNNTLLLLWTEHIARLSASIIFARFKFINSFLPIFRDLYKQFNLNEHPSINYRCSFGNITDCTPVELLYDYFLLKYKEIEKQEIQRGLTLIGPHRDDLVFELNNKEIKKYASQGQLRTFLITLKLTQYHFFNQISDKKPICLLDDIFSELDIYRIENILAILETCGQTIITSTALKEQHNVTPISIESITKFSHK